MLCSKSFAREQQGTPSVRLYEVGICTGTAGKELPEGGRRMGFVERGSTGQEGRLRMKFLGDQSGDWICFILLLMTFA